MLGFAVGAEAAAENIIAETSAKSGHIWLHVFFVKGNNPENQNLAVWFCVRPGPTPFFAFGTPARFRVTGAASCGHYAAGAAGKKNCRPPPLI